VGLAACGRDPTARAQAEALAAVAAVSLPAVRRAGLEPPEPRARIVVGAQGIDVDDAAVFASWPEPARRELLRALPEDEAAALPFVHRKLLRISGWSIAPPDTPAPGQLDLPPLREVLEYEAGIERRHAALVDAEPARLAANVYVDRDAPYGLVTRVLHSAAQAGYGLAPVVRGPGGERVLPFRLGATRVCLGLELRIFKGGIALKTEDRRLTEVEEKEVEVGLAELAASLGLPPQGERRAPKKKRVPPIPGKAQPTARGRMVLGPDRACPSVPRRSEELDLARLDALLREVRAAIPACESIVVTASAETPWRALCAVVEQSLEAGYAGFQLGLPRDDADGDCSRGIMPAELNPAASRDDH
jgi:hypothetical protein